ncbi:hypothetical protein KY329_05355 [Candidatus Woesearchaeota archaeon]|nr:hypothetical protein [Candidatus Woesearchaeota archaeon]
MDLDELTERTTAPFPNEISLDEAQALLLWVARQTGMNIGYSVKDHKHISHDHENPTKIDFYSTGADVTGHFHKIVAPFGHTTFSLTRGPEDLTKYSALVFQPTVDYDVEDHAAQEVAAWDLLREKTAEYFK